MARTARLALVGILAVVSLTGCLQDISGFIAVRVVNNTGGQVRIRPCWDKYCRQMQGMPVQTLAPGDSLGEAQLWSNDAPGVIAVALLDRAGNRIGCVTTSFSPGEKKMLVHISDEARCKRPSEFAGAPSGF